MTEAPRRGLQLRTLLRLSVRGLSHHAARLVLTVVTVAVSTAFICSTLILGSAVSGSVDSLMTGGGSGNGSDGSTGADVVVLPAGGERTLPGETADLVAGDSLVDRVVLRDTRSVMVGDAADTSDPTDAVPAQPSPWYGADEALDPDQHLVTGHEPGPGEVVVPDTEGGDTGFSVGDEITVTDRSGSFPLRVSGIFSSSGGNGGPDAALPLALAMDDYLGHYASDGLPGLSVRGTDRASAEEIVESLQTALADQAPDSPRVLTADDPAVSGSAAVADGLGYLRFALPAFGFLALVVSMLTIANTFAMTVGQRTRDFTLLRSLGLSKRQVTTSVLGEAAVTGLLGSVFGVALGVSGAFAASRVISRVLPQAPAVDVSPDVVSVLVPLVLGTLVTVVAARTPARRAAGGSSSSSSAAATASGVVLVLLAAGATAAGAVGPGGWSMSARAGLCGAGFLGLLVGVHLLSPALVALVALLPAPGTTARLAVRSAGRTPRRTARTAFALTLGLSLVTVTAMVGVSVTASVHDAVDSEVTADYVVAAPGGATDAAVPGPVAGALPDADGVGSTYTVGKALVSVGDTATGSDLVATVSDGDPSTVLDLGAVHGELRPGTDDAVTMSASFAREHGWEIGDTVPVGVPGLGHTADMTLTGTYTGSRLLGDVVVGASAFWRLAPGAQGMGGHRILAAVVSSDGSVPAADLRSSLEETAQQAQDGHPRGSGGSGGSDGTDVDVLTPAEFAGAQTTLIDRVTAVIYALLLLAVVVAVLGVSNSLALSVVERRREIGLLRAVGVSRGGIRRMVTVEALLTCVLGALLGVGLGLAGGAAFLTVMSEAGLSTVVVPWTAVGAVLVGSAVVGVLTAMLASARAAAVPPLEAVEP